MKNNMNLKNLNRSTKVTIISIIVIISLAIIYYLTLYKGIPGNINAKDYNIVIITLDTTRADFIGAYGSHAAQTPNIDSLAKKGVMFQNCYTSVPITLPSHSSIFTGKYPISHQVRDNGIFNLNHSHTTLAEILKESGYTTNAVIASYVLLSKFGLNQGFDSYDDSLKANELIVNLDSEIKADQVYEKFRKILDQKKSSPFFSWIHFYDPHSPYNPPDEFKSKYGPSPIEQYNAEIAYTDYYVGKIINDLKNMNLLDNTIIIIAGDHGEAFGEHHEYGHSLLCYEESLKVPLIFYNPKLINYGLKVKNRVNLIDIMPTVLDMVGLTTPPNIQGKSLINLLEGKKEADKRTYYIETMHGKEEYGWAPLTGLIHNQYKFISVPEPELYDLSNDKAEKNNLFWKMNRLSKDMDKTLMNLVKSVTSTSTNSGDSRQTLSEKDKQHLQSLGYVSAFSDNTQTNLDPKQGVILSNQFHKIENEINAGQLDQAKSDLEELGRKNPKNKMPQYYGMLNTIYKKKSDTRGVIETWQQAINAFPNNDNLKINLAFEFFQMNRIDESDRIASEILKHDPLYTRALILRGRIAEKKGLTDQTLSFYTSALSQEPNNISLKISYAKLIGNKGNLTEAKKICDELLNDPTIATDPSLKSKIAAILTETTPDDQALPLLQDAANSGKDDAETWNSMGIIFYRKGQFDKALDAYKKSIEKDPKIAQTYNNLGTLYLTAFIIKKQSQLRDLALNSFNKALSLDPNLVSALNGRGSAFRLSNKIQDSIKDWKKVISIDPNFTDAYFNLAVTYLQLKSKPEALKYLSTIKEKLSQKLSPKEQQRLNRLIAEAGH